GTGAADDVEIACRFAEAFVGYVAYDAVHPVHRVAPWPNEGRLARMLRGATIVVFDNLKQTLTIAARSLAEIERCVDAIHRAPPLAPLEPPDGSAAPLDVEVTMDDAAYGERVERAKEYIRAGDAFQIVLARSFLVPRKGTDPFEVYRALRVLSPSPYLY